MEPVKFSVSLRVSAVIGNFVGQASWGKLIIRYLDLPLEDPIVEVDIDEGEARAELRPGTYMVYYVEESLNITSRPAVIEVNPGQASYEVALEVDPIALEIRLADIELGTSIDAATLVLSYTGPLGSLTLRESLSGGRVQVEIPPGIYTIIASAEGYEDTVTRLNLTEPGSLTIYQPPVKVSVTLNFRDMDGRLVALDGIVARFAHRDLPLTFEFYSKDGIVETSGLRLGTYFVEIEPPADSEYRPVTVVLDVTRDGANQSTITLPFKEYNVTIELVETDTGTKAKGAYRVELSRREPGSPELGFPLAVVVEGETTILLPQAPTRPHYPS
jgi:hypothetical protein